MRGRGFQPIGYRDSVCWWRCRSHPSSDVAYSSDDNLKTVFLVQISNISLKFTYLWVENSFQISFFLNSQSDFSDDLIP